MSNEIKKRQLKRHKILATGLFLVMCLLFLGSSILLKHKPSLSWLGFVRAFSEAAMVGALADWFAVTALFHHPLGFKIPHTNLIEKSKEKIGNNLGDFVVGNFLSPQNIRPYIKKIKISSYLSSWLLKENNRLSLMNFSFKMLKDLLLKTDDEKVILFLNEKIKSISEEFHIHIWLSQMAVYLLERNDHQTVITTLSAKLKDYIVEHHDLVRSRVKKESFVLIPSFVDDKIASKITIGLAKFFQEIELDNSHLIRKEITEQLYAFSLQIKENAEYIKKITELKSVFFQSEKSQNYIKDFWNYGKKNILTELENHDSALHHYLEKNLNNFAVDFSNNPVQREKIDRWARRTLYQIFLKNKDQFGMLIAETVGNWKGRELSEKLELEVGKDLQFIRINGTLVGGLVGLLIYTISQVISEYM